MVSSNKPEQFHLRLQQACNDLVTVPEHGKGRQVYLARKLKVSQEAVRKWFTGDARPRVMKMQHLAQVLDVDPAWLALGTTPQLSKSESRAYSAHAEGAAYIAFGLITMAGGHCAFPGSSDPRYSFIDLYAIIRGQQLALIVAAGRLIAKNRWSFIVPREYHEGIVVGIIPVTQVKFHVIKLSHSMLDEFKSKKGGALEVVVDYIDAKYTSGDQIWPRITSAADII